MTARQGPVTICVSSSSDRSSLRALFAPRFDELPGVAHKVFATEAIDDKTGEASAESHWAEVEWDFAVGARGVSVLWPNGLAPQSFAAKVRVDDVWLDLGEPTETQDGRWTWLAALSCDGMRFEQAADGGHQDFPRAMRIRGAALLPATPEADVALELGDGALVPLEMPVLTTWRGTAVLDVSDAHALRLKHDGSAIAAVVITAQRIGESGNPADIRSWASSLTSLRLRSGEEWTESGVQASVDESQAGLLCGTVEVLVRLDEPMCCDEVAFDLPSRGGSILGLTGVTIIDRLEARPAVGSAELPPLGVQAAIQTVNTPCLALPIGAGGDGARFGVTTTGVIEVKHSAPWRSRGRALLIRLHGDTFEPVRFAGDSGVVLMGDARAYALDPRVEDGRHLLRISAPAFEAGFSFSLVAVDGLNPLRCRWSEDESVVYCDDEPVLRAEGRVDVRLEGLELRVRIEGDWVDLVGEEAGESAEKAGPLGGRPAVLEPQVNALLAELGRFRGPDGRVSYGRYPSPYHGMTFGLEEDYGFFGAMLWGANTFALEAFDATYLDPGHLDPKHYLHDLRHSLLPWQMWRLCRLANEDASTLFGDRGRAALSTCAAWIRAQRTKTRDAVGAADADGVRVFAGLLPPGRFGGDLDFRTQSLYLSAVAAVSLGALGELETDADSKAVFADESAEMSAAVMTAFEAVSDAEFVPLDTGGGEPGPYYQLAASGVLHPVSFFAEDAPLARQIDRFMEEDDRLNSGLPRFDAWGTSGPGDDAHYGLGYLLRCLRDGRRDRFREGLQALVSAGDDCGLSYREVRPLGPQWGASAHLPGRALCRSEPCIGAFGAALILLRHAWVTERFRTGWSTSGSLFVFGGLEDEFWDSEPMFSSTFPTLKGPLGLTAFPSEDGWTLRVLMPPGATVEVAPPPSSSPVRRIVTAAGIQSADDVRAAGFVCIVAEAPWVRFERVDP